MSKNKISDKTEHRFKVFARICLHLTEMMDSQKDKVAFLPYESPHLTQKEKTRLANLPGLIDASKEYTASLELERITLTEVYTKNGIEKRDKVLKPDEPWTTRDDEVFERYENSLKKKPSEKRMPKWGKKDDAIFTEYNNNLKKKK